MALSYIKDKYNINKIRFTKNPLNKIIINNIHFLSITNKVCIYSAEFIFYSTFLNPIINLEPNDKIGIIDTSFNKLFNFKLYLDKYNIYQSFNRWYNNQKREYIFEKLDLVFNKYTKYIKSIEALIIHKDTLTELYNDILKFNTILINKLKILKETYNDIDISKKIDNYINLCNFM